MTLIDPQDAPPSVSHRDLANAIRALSMDAVEHAKSGHPGMPMGMADVATVLFTKSLKFDPDWPDWPDRDRFVLSAGHGSMLLYSLLYLTGYRDMTIDEIRRFRQLGSRAPGHPEYGAASGVETTTGPLGQGLANAVGMAIAERQLAARFGAELVDHRTYVMVGDGCLMEGISHEAASLAGHLALDRLIVIFDDNGISIDGPTSLTTSDDHVARFAAQGWDTQRVNGHDPQAIEQAIAAARTSAGPSFIACRTTIGYGAPNKEGTAATHGAPLGDAEVAAARERLGWPHSPFTIPAEILAAWREAGARGQAASRAWHERRQGLSAAKRAAFDETMSGELPPQLEGALTAHKKMLSNERPTRATRASSQQVLEVINSVVTTTIGGSADLTGSNNTLTNDLGLLTRDNYEGRYIHYGVREHAMAATMNGLALHGGTIPYGGTFLVFTDYLRPALRLSALMEQRVIYVMTHDSIGLGEDGPTHQPVEHLAALRTIPGLHVYRPADAVETTECWALALGRRDGPSVIALTRQSLPTLRAEHTADNLCARGGYELLVADGAAKVSLLATGSEVALAANARELLQARGIATRVVSLPCWELFDQQEPSYREAVLGGASAQVAIEAATTHGWERYTGPRGSVIGMPGFGASAPARDLFEHFSITADAVVAAAMSQLEGEVTDDG